MYRLLVSDEAASRASEDSKFFENPLKLCLHAPFSGELCTDTSYSWAHHTSSQSPTRHLELLK